MKLQDYFNYIAEPVNFVAANKILLTISSVIFGAIYCVIGAIHHGFVFMATSLSISITFIVLYFALAFADLIFGIYANVFVLKEKFESKKFIKKFLLIGFGIGNVLNNSLWRNDQNDCSRGVKQRLRE